MAERLAPGNYDQLHHFVAAGVWDAAPLEKELLVQADKLVGGSDAVLVIDDTAVPKKGIRSVSLGNMPQRLASRLDAVDFDRSPHAGVVLVGDHEAFPSKPVAAIGA
jgi:hypothetical protein